MGLRRMRGRRGAAAGFGVTLAEVNECNGDVTSIRSFTTQRQSASDRAVVALGVSDAVFALLWFVDSEENRR